MKLDPEWIYDCLWNCEDDHININRCSNFLTFSENTMNTKIFRDIVFKIISNSSVKSINISQIDYKWFVLLKLYYCFIGGKKLKWIKYGKYCNSDMWEHSPDTIDNNVKPFWENFKIKYVCNLFKHAGFFVKNGEIFLQKLQNNQLSSNDVSDYFDSKSKGKRRRNHMLKDQKNKKNTLIRKERLKIKLRKKKKKTKR